MKFSVLSLFPSYFTGPFDESIVGRATRRGLLEISLVDMREYSTDARHHKVDDRPYGGGPGMVLMAEPVVAALRSAKTPSCRTVYLSPQGKTLTAAKAQELAKYDHLVLLCGHYEGIDERALAEVDEEISIGDYVLTNGCLAAIVLVDAVCRFLPGVLGHEAAAIEESFQQPLLDCPHYTRPEVFEGSAVPQVLLGGNHRDIEAWRYSRALEKTRRVRPDLLFIHEQERVGDRKAAKDGRETERAPALQVSAVTLWVVNLKRSLEFYRYVWGLKREGKQDKVVTLAGKGVRLHLIEAAYGPSAPMAVVEIVAADSGWLDEVQRRLDGEKIAYLRQQGWLEVADPDGHLWRFVLRDTE